MKTTPTEGIEAYLAGCPAPSRKLLKQLRATIRANAPGAEEVISYRMPAFRLNGMLVWYAAHKTHIGFYPRASGIAAFKRELSVYRWAKGSVQFPLDQPLPLALIARIVKFRVKENRAKEKDKAPAKR